MSDVVNHEPGAPVAWRLLSADGANTYVTGRKPSDDDAEPLYDHPCTCRASEFPQPLVREHPSRLVRATAWLFVLVILGAVAAAALGGAIMILRDATS